MQNIFESSILSPNLVVFCSNYNVCILSNVASCCIIENSIIVMLLNLCLCQCRCDKWSVFDWEFGCDNETLEEKIATAESKLYDHFKELKQSKENSEKLIEKIEDIINLSLYHL